LERKNGFKAHFDAKKQQRGQKVDLWGEKKK